MGSATVKRWFGSHEDAHDTGVLGALYELEMKIQRMLVGILMFFLETMPDFWKWLWNWLLAKVEFLVRVSVRLCRILGLLAALLVVVFGPVWLIPWWISSGWMVLTIIGCIYGLNRVQKRRKSASANTITLMPRKA